MKNLLIIGLMMLTLGACSPTGLFDSATPTPELTPTPLPTPVTVYQTTISADGQVVLPLPPQVFRFPSGIDGQIAAVYITVGQAVQKGQLLVTIEDSGLRNAIKQAEARLDILKAEIETQRIAPRDSEIAEARSNLDATQKEYARVKSLPSEEVLTQAAADLRLQEISLRRAQEAYDAVAYAQGIGMSPQAAELQQATLNHEKALALYEEATKPASDSELATVRLRVTEAETRLDKLLAGETSQQEILNMSRIKQAELELEEAQSNLEKANMYAPWDGIITEVNASVGVHVSQATVTIAQVEPLRFATTNFTERNLNEIEIGDKATIYLKSFPGVEFPAVLQRVDLQAAGKDGDTALFIIYFDFNAGDLTVRPGMTGRVEIDLQSTEN